MLFGVLWMDKQSFNLLLVKRLAAERLMSNVWLAFTEIFANLIANVRYTDSGMFLLSHDFFLPSWLAELLPLSGFANMEEGGEIRISDITKKLRLWAEYWGNTHDFSLRGFWKTVKASLSEIVISNDISNLLEQTVSMSHLVRNSSSFSGKREGGDWGGGL